MKKISTLLLFCITLLFSSASMAQSTDLFVGNWKVEIKDTPYGTIKFELILERVAGKLTGRIVDERSHIESKMNYITENGNSLKLNFPFHEFLGVDQSLILDFHDDELRGSMTDWDFQVSGTRVKK
jgi:hypothetical protein